MNEIQLLAAQAALAKMMRNGWVDITVFDKILKMTNAVPNRQDYEILHLLHCVHFVDMDLNLRRGLPVLFDRVLQAESINYQFGETYTKLLSVG